VHSRLVEYLLRLFSFLCLLDFVHPTHINPTTHQYTPIHAQTSMIPIYISIYPLSISILLFVYQRGSDQQRFTVSKMASHPTCRGSIVRDRSIPKTLVSLLTAENPIFVQRTALRLAEVLTSVEEFCVPPKVLHVLPLFASILKTDELELRSAALDSLVNISCKGDRHTLIGMREAGCLVPLLMLLEEGEAAHDTQLERVLLILSRAASERGNKHALGEMGLVEALCALLKSLPHDQPAKETVLSVLARLASLSHNRVELLSCGLAPLLCDLIEQPVPEPLLLQLLVLLESLLVDGL
jgi:hypothetical protein